MRLGALDLFYAGFDREVFALIDGHIDPKEPVPFFRGLLDDIIAIVDGILALIEFADEPPIAVIIEIIAKDRPLLCTSKERNDTK